MTRPAGSARRIPVTGSSRWGERGAPQPLLWLVVFALVVAIPGAHPSQVAAAEVSTTFIAEADAQVTESAPNANHAAAPLRADGGVDPDVESHLQFAVSGVTGQVIEATLRIYASTGTVDGPAVYKTSAAWSETSITWNNRPAKVGGPVDDVAGIAAASWVEYDVTSLVTGNGTVAVALATASSDGVDFHAREGAQKPQVVVRTSTTPPDTVAPRPPTDVAASSTSATEVVLSWTAAIDETGVTGYEIHRNGVLLAAIAPATSYTDRSTWSSTSFSYRLRARDAAGNWSSLSAAATVTTPAGADPTLVAAGDIATCGQPGHAATAALLDSIPGVVATLGDMAYPNGTAAEFRDCYGPTWGRHLARTRPAPGNHEYNTAGASGYYDYFGAAAGDRTKGYYSYEVGAWHVVVLNSSCAAVSGCQAGSPQEQWLRADLAAHPASCTLAYWHHPLFSTGFHGPHAFMRPMYQALYDAGAELVLSGHEHTYERFAPQTPAGIADSPFGIRQFVVGTGGRDSHRTVPTGGGNSQIANAVTYGVLRLELGSASYTWTFVPEAGKTFTDSGTGSCHAPPNSGPTTHTLSGTVTAGGTGLPGARIYVFDATTAAYVANTLTAAGGTYSLNLPQGSYKLWIETNEPGYPDQSHGPDGTFANATVINLSANRTANVALAAAAVNHTLSGTVTAGGTGLPGARIYVFDATTAAYVANTLTAAGGTYSLNLPQGSYKLWIETNEPGYPDQSHGPDGTFANATVINLSANRTANVALAAAVNHTLSGTVTAGGTGLPGARIYVFDATTAAYVANTLTAAGGTYSLNLPQGSYKLWIETNEPGYPDQSHGPDGTFANATVINLSANRTANVVLAAAVNHTLSGTVTAGGTGLPGARIYVFDATTAAYVANTLTAAGGTYSLNLPQGSYKLWIETNEPGYPDQSHGPDGTFANATVINLSANRTANVVLAASP